MDLNDFFKENPQVALAFSGGVDSSYLLYAGIENGADIKAYYVKTAFQPEFELRDALELARRLGARITVLKADVSGERNIFENPPDRCYYCKRVIFDTILKQASADGYKLVIDGSNASDDAEDRPGMRALKELSVRSPLRECGLSKNEIRELSKSADLPTWDKPAYACLATRIPSGREITAELLRKVESAEDALFAMGFSDFRIRVAGDAAKLQLPSSQMPAVLEKREAIIDAVKPFFSDIWLDLNAR